MSEVSETNHEEEVPIINEFCITTCTVNGSGSATANHILYRTLFHLGIPTSGKNISPSNSKVWQPGLYSEFLKKAIPDGSPTMTSLLQ